MTAASGATAQRGEQPRSRSGMCAPTVNINIAKPTSLRNCTVGFRRVDQVQAGTPDHHAREDLADHDRHEHRAPGAEQRPARPASTISASTPKSTGLRLRVCGERQTTDSVGAPMAPPSRASSVALSIPRNEAA